MKEGRYCEKFIQKQDVVKAMGGKSDYENLVLAAMVNDKVKYACSGYWR